MLKIGSEKVFTETEIIENVRDAFPNMGREWDKREKELIALTLAKALDEPMSFIRGALGVKS
jgi:hypothetical protein